MNDFLTSKEVRNMLGVCELTMARMRRSGRGPKFIRLGLNCVRYGRADVEAWLESVKVSNPVRDQAIAA